MGTNFIHVWEDQDKTRVVVRIQEHFIDKGLDVLGIQRIFNEADLDNTGVINLKEFTVFLLQIDLQPALSTSDIRKLFVLFDETHSGFINFFEFCHVVFPDLDVEGMAEDHDGGFTYCIPAFEQCGGQPGAGQGGGQGGGGGASRGACTSIGCSSETSEGVFAKPTLHALSRERSVGSIGSVGSVGSIGSIGSTSQPLSSPISSGAPSPARSPLKARPSALRLGFFSDASSSTRLGESSSQLPSKRRGVQTALPPWRRPRAGSADDLTVDAEAMGMMAVEAEVSVERARAQSCPRDPGAGSCPRLPEGATSRGAPPAGSPDSESRWSQMRSQAGQEVRSQWGRSRPEDASRARLRAVAAFGGGSRQWGGSIDNTFIGDESSVASELSSCGGGGGAASQLDEMTERLERTISQAVRGAELRLARAVSQSEARLAERLDKIEASVVAAAAAAAAAADSSPAAVRLAQKQLHKISPPSFRASPLRNKKGSGLAGLLSGRASVRKRGETSESPRVAVCNKPVIVSEAV